MLLSHYFPYTEQYRSYVDPDTQHPLAKHGLREFREKTITTYDWGISVRNIVDIIHKAMVLVWRKDMALMGRHIRSLSEYVKSMEFELNSNPKIVRRIPRSVLRFIVEGTGTQLYVAKQAHPEYE